MTKTIRFSAERSTNAMFLPSIRPNFRKDAKIGSLHTLLPHLPPLIEQPALGQLRIANELIGLTVAYRVLNEVPRDFWLHHLGLRSRRVWASDSFAQKPDAYLKARWQRRVGPAILKTTPVLA